MTHRCGNGARARRRRRNAQKGVVLFIALIVLVAMTLAGIALSRSVGTGVMIAGNLAFQRGAAHSADAAIEAARTWLSAQSAVALRDDQAPGYYASWQPAFNPQTFNWAAAGRSAGTDAAGNSMSYVIHRLCQNAGESVNAPGQQCVTLQSSGTGTPKGGGSYGFLPLIGTLQVYYRVTVRVSGPRNTVSYVQAVMY